MPTDELPRSILLLQSGALGDSILQLRLAESLRRALPQTYITWLGRDAWLPLAQRCPAINEALGLDARRTHRLFQPGTETDHDLAQFLARFDLAINGLTGPDSPLMDRLRRFARQAAVSYEARPAPALPRHVCRQWIDQLAAALAPSWPDLPAALEVYTSTLDAQPAALLKPNPNDLSAAAERLRAEHMNPDEAARRLVLLHPGSGGLHKCWPIDRYLDLAGLLSQQGLRPLIILGQAELDRWSDRLAVLLRRAALLADPPLETLLALMTMAAAYVGNDAGPTHLAAAAGTRCIALFGPTDPSVWQPLGPKVIVLTSQEHAQGWHDLPAQDVARQLEMALAPPRA